LRGKKRGCPGDRMVALSAARKKKNKGGFRYMGKGVLSKEGRGGGKKVQSSTKPDDLGAIKGLTKGEEGFKEANHNQRERSGLVPVATETRKKRGTHGVFRREMTVAHKV